MITAIISSRTVKRRFDDSPSRLALEIRAGKSLGAAAATPFENTGIGRPPQNRPMFIRMNETPIADTRGASLGALRSGL